MSKPIVVDPRDTQRVSIPGDKVQQALGRLVTDGEIDEAARADIWWFYSHLMDRNIGWEAAGKELGKDGSTIYRLLTGSYGARYDGLVDSVRRYRSLAEARGNRRTCGFIETETYRKIETVCRHALVSQAPVFIFGASQVGKTTCLEEYARRNNHGQTRYIRMCAAPGLVDAQREVAKACYISARVEGSVLRERLLSAVTSQMLLIVDEMHQALLPGCRESTAVRIIEWFRELYDRTHCGIVFCGTQVFRRELEEGRLSLVLEQFRRRGIIQLVLPAKPPKADVVKIAAAFDLPAPEGTAAELVETMLARSGLGQYVKFLQSASNLAARQKKPLSWDHFVIAHDLVAQLSAPTKE